MSIVLAALLLLQEDTGEQFFKFRVGTRWTYKSVDNDSPEAARRVIMTVTKQEGSKTCLDSVEYRGEEKEPKVEKLVWQTEGGLLYWADESGGTPKKIFNLYKTGTKKGDRWDGGSQKPKLEVTHEGVEDVKTAMATHKDAVRIVIRRLEKHPDGGEIGSIFWLAPRVGLVKVQTGLGDQKNTLELTEFKEGK